MSVTDDSNILDTESYAMIDRFFERARWVYLGGDVEDELSGLREALLVTVLGYMLRKGSDPAQYPGYGPFIPFFQFEDRVSAPPFDAVAPEMGQAWEQLGLQCRTPAARALFLDLAWCAKAGDTPGRLGSSAIGAYLELATTGTELQDAAEDKGWIPCARAECLRRALSLARELNQRDRLSGVCAAIEAAATTAITHHSVGTAMLLLRELVHLPPNLRPPSLVRMLDNASTRFGDSVWEFTEIGDLRASLAASPDERRAIHYEQLDHLVADAKAQIGIGRADALQKAAEFAHENELKDRLPEIRREIDAITPESLELKEVSVEIEVPQALFDRFIQSFAAPDTLTGSLERFALAGGSPPSGDHERNLEQVRQSR